MRSSYPTICPLHLELRTAVRSHWGQTTLRWHATIGVWHQNAPDLFESWSHGTILHHYGKIWLALTGVMLLATWQQPVEENVTKILWYHTTRRFKTYRTDCTGHHLRWERLFMRSTRPEPGISWIIPSVCTTLVGTSHTVFTLYATGVGIFCVIFKLCTTHVVLNMKMTQEIPGSATLTRQFYSAISDSTYLLPHPSKLAVATG